MNVQPNKHFVFRMMEEDLYLFVHLIEHTLGQGVLKDKPFSGAELSLLKLHWRELSRTLDTAYDDEPAAPTEAAKVPETVPQQARPVCPVHGKPMWHQQGKHGWFWSCHQRDEDGSYCSYRPGQAAA
jgi:hypothetical protein